MDRAQSKRANASGGAAVQLHQVNKTGIERLKEGIGILTRCDVVTAESLNLRGGHRVAQRARLRTPAGRLVDVYNTHLHHRGDAGELRLTQARLIVDWIAQHDDVPAIFVGDLNATPESPPVAVVRDRLRSAYALVHDDEPVGTVPTPLNHEWGQPPKTIDYVCVDPDLRVHDARIVFDRVDPDDRLCASDHYGIVADISLV